MVQHRITVAEELRYDVDVKAVRGLSTTYVPFAQSVNTVAASGAAVTLPASTTASIHHVTLTANCTLTFPATTAGQSFTVVLKQDATGSRTVTWPGSVVWPGGTAPTLTTTANKRDVFKFVSPLGSVWFGSVFGQAY